MRDHLGYRFELQRLATSRGPAGLALSLQVANRGFAPIHRRCTVAFLWLRNATLVAAQQVDDADPRAWQPFTPGDPARAPLTFTLNATLAMPPAGAASSPLDLGLRIEVVGGDGAPLPHPLYVRVANDLPWDAPNGANVLLRDVS